MSEKWTELVAQFDTMIRLGQADAVRTELTKIIPKEIPRPFVVAIARLTRRVRLNDFTLRILKPIIQAEAVLDLPASEVELALYAGALIRIGGRKQGLEILSKLNSEKNPEVLLFQMDALFSEWNYAQAIPLIEKYLTSVGISDYQKLVGRLNLAAAYVFENSLDLAQELLGKIQEDCQLNGHHLLYANSLEISAQISLLRRNFQKAHQELDLASQALKDEASSYRFFIRKWNATSEFMQKPQDPESIQNFNNLRAESKEMKDWESIRQMDFQQALMTGNQELYLYAMAGTPYTNYRNAWQKKFANPPPLPAEFQMCPGGSTKNGSPTLHVPSGRFGNVQLEPGSLAHRLLIFISMDYYRPLLVGEAFSRLYEDEYFDSETSPDRVRSVVKSLSQWFVEQKIPLAVQSDRQALFLCSEGPIDLVTSTTITEISRDSYRLNELKAKVDLNWFSAKEAAAILEISSRSAQRMLTISVEQGDLQAQGNARSRRYSFKKI